jgi:fibronectin-binding autotransporter adhesin
MKGLQLRTWCLVAAAVVSIVPSPTRAATDVWTGTDATFPLNWNANNWFGGNSPPLATDVLVFGTANGANTTLNNNLPVDFILNGISFIPNAASAYTFNGNEITLNGNINNFSSALETINFGIFTNAARTVTMGAAAQATQNIIFNGVISGNGGGITTAGTGTLVLNAANLYNGNTTSSTSTASILLGNANAVQNSNVNLTVTGGLSFASSIGTFNIGSLQGSAALALTDASSSAVTLSIGANNGSQTYSAILSGGGAITKVGTGTETFTGANSYTGLTTIYAGTISINNTTTFGSHGLRLFGGALTNAGTSGIFDFATGGTGTLIAPGGRSTITLNNSVTSVNKLGAITRNVGGNLIFSLGTGGGTVTTSTALTNGVLMDSGVAYATVGTTDWASEKSDGTIIAVGGTGALGSYTASTPTSLGTAATNADLVAGSNGQVALAADTTINTLRYNVNDAAHAINLGGFTLTSGGILMGSGNTTTANVLPTLTISNGTLKGPAGKDLVIIQNGTAPMTVSATIADNSGTGLTKGGGGQLFLTGHNTFSGDFNLNEGSLTISFLDSLGTGNVLNMNGTTLQYASGFSGPTDLSGRTVSIGAFNATIDTNGNNVTYANSIGNGGQGGLIKTGLGNLTLNGGANYKGITTVSAGGLIINGSLAPTIFGLTLGSSGPSSLTINNTTGANFIQGGTTVNGSGASAIISAGTSGITVLGGITRNGGATVDFTLPTGTAAITTTTANIFGGILGGWATVGGTDWATNTGIGNSTGLGIGSSTIAALSAGSYTSNTWANSNNTNVTSSTAVPANSLTNSLRFNAGAATTLTLSGVNGINSGGILVTPNVGANVSTITGGILRGAVNGVNELIVQQFNTSASLVIGSTIVDSTQGTGLTKAGGGTLILTGANFYSGQTRANQGVIQLGNANALQNSSLAVNSPNGVAFSTGIGTFNVGSLQGLRNFSLADVSAGNITLSIGADNSNQTYNGVMSGGGGLTKVGSGTETLAGANLYTGTTTINGLGNSGGLTLTANAFNGTLNATLPATLASPALVLGGGTLTINNFSAGVSFSSGTTVNAGAGVINASASTGVNALAGITRNSGGTLTVTLPTAAGTVTTTSGNSNGILGGWAVTGTAAAPTTDWAANNGSNTLVALSSYTTDNWTDATTNVTVAGNSTQPASSSANSVRFNAAGAATVTLSGTNVITSGGILVTPNVAASATAIAGTSASDSIAGSAGGDLVVNQFNTGTLTISALIANNTSATGLTKTGGGTLVINNTGNSFSGPINLNNGILSFVGSGSLGAGTAINFNGGTLQYGASTSTDISTRNVTINAPGGTIDAGAATNVVTFNNAIGNGSSTGGITKAGAGTLILAASNAIVTSANQSFVPGMTLSAGVLQLNNTGALQNVRLNDNVNVAITSGVYTAGLAFSSTATGGNNFAVGSLAGNGNLGLQDNAVAPNPITLTLGGDNSNATYSGVLSGAGGLVKNGSGLQALTGASSFTGNVVINGGILFTNNGRGDNTATSSLGDALFVPPSQRGATAVGAAASGDQDINPVGGRTVTINNGGTLQLNGNDFSGGSTIVKLGIVVNSGGVLRIRNSNSTIGPLTLNGGTLSADNQFSQQFESFSLAGILTVGGSSPSFINPNQADTGNVPPLFVPSFIPGMNVTTQGQGGPATFNIGQTGGPGPDLTISVPLVNSGGSQVSAGIVKTGAGTVLLNSANIYSLATTVSQGVVQLGNANALQRSAANPLINGGFTFSSGIGTFNTAGLMGTGNIALTDLAAQNVTLAVTANNSNGVYSGVLSGGGSLTVTGNGYLTLSGTNTYSGTTTIGTAASPNVLGAFLPATLIADSSSALGTSTVTFAGGTLQYSLNSNHDYSNKIANSTGPISIDVVSGQSVNFGSAIAGSNQAGLSKTGLGNLTLSATNAYAGPTTVRAGTLTLDKTSAGNRLNGGVLNLSGGTLTLSGGSSAETLASTTISPGASAVTRSSGSSTLALGAITRNPGGVVDFASGGLATTSTANSSGILGGWATVGGTDWATSSGGTVTALASYTPNTWGAGLNTDVSATATYATPQTTNSLRFNQLGPNLTLTGTNTITSGGILLTSNVSNSITVSGGTLVGSSGGDLIINQNNINTGVPFTISSTIADNGSATALTKTGVGALVLTGANTYGGPTYLEGGVTTISANNAFGDGAKISVASSNTNLNVIQLANPAPANFVVGSRILGQTVTAINGKAVVLGGNANANTTTNTATDYIAPLTLNGGTLQFAGAFTMAGTAGNRNITVGPNGGTVDLNFQNVTFSGLLSGNGTLNVVNGAGTSSSGLTLNNTGSTFTGSLNITGGSTVTVNGDPGNNTNITQLGYGTVTIGNSSKLAFVKGGGGNGNNFFLGNNLVFDGGTLWIDDGVYHFGENTNGGTLSTITVTPNGGTLQSRYTSKSIILDGQLIGTGPLTFSNTGQGGNERSGIHITNPTNTYSGTITVNANTGPGYFLGIDSNTALINADVVVNGTSGNNSGLLFGGYLGTGGTPPGGGGNAGPVGQLNMTTPTVGSFGGNGNISVPIGVTFTVGNNGNTTTYSGTMSGAGGLNKIGGGTMTLSPSTANTYTGPTILTGGILAITDLQNAGTGSSIGASDATTNPASNLVFNGGTMQYTGTGSSTNRNWTVGAGGGTIDSSGTGPIALNGSTISFTATTGSQTLTLTGTNTGGNNTIGGSINNGSGGTTALTKTGSNTWVLTGANTYSGPTTISSGGLTINGSLGSTAVSVASGSTYSISGAAGPIGGGTSLLVGGGGTVNLPGGNGAMVVNVTGPLTIGGSGGVVPINYTNTVNGLEYIAATGALTLNSPGGGLPGAVVNLSDPLNLIPGHAAYPLLTYASKSGTGSFSFSPTSVVNTFHFGRNDYFLNTSSTQLDVSVTGPVFPNVAYFTGTVNNIWADVSTSQNNWSKDISGTPDTGNIPGVISDVYLNSQLQTGSVTTTLGLDLPINSLHVNSQASSNTVAADTHTLTINAAATPGDPSTPTPTPGNVAGDGIVIDSGSQSDFTFGANLALGTALPSQTWTNKSSHNFNITGNVKAIANTGTQTLTVKNTGTGITAFSGVLSDGTAGGKFALNIDGGTTTISGSNTYTGGTSVTSGTLKMLTGGSLGAATSPLVVNGGELDLNDTNQTVGGLSSTLTAGKIVNNGSSLATLTVGSGLTGTSVYNGTIVDHDGVVSGTVGITKVGSGTVALAANGNTYTGATNINQGTLQIGNGGTTGSMGPASATINVNTGGTLSVNRSDTYTLPYIIGGDGAGTFSQAGTAASIVVLNQANSYGNTSIGNGTATGGSLRLDTNGTVGTGPVTVGSGTAATSGTLIFNEDADTAFTNVIAGPGAVIKQNTGNVTLSANSSFTGNLTITGGTITNTAVRNVANPVTSGLGNPAVARSVIVQPTGILNLNEAGGNGFGDGGTNPQITLFADGGIINSNSGNNTIGFLKLDGGTVNITAIVNQQYQGLEIGRGLTVTTVRNSPAVIQSTDPTFGIALTITGAGNNAQTPIDIGAFSPAQPTVPELTISARVGNQGSTGNATGQGQTAAGFIKTGAGTMLLSGDNTFSGPINLNAGVVQVGSATALGTGGNIVFGGGTLKYKQSAGFNNDYSARIVNSTAGPISIDTDTLNVGFSTVLPNSNTGGLTKLGLGTLNLGAAEAYTGTTTVSGGTLLVSGSIPGASATNVNAGGRLLVNGSVVGTSAVTVAIGTVGPPALAGGSLGGFGTIGGAVTVGGTGSAGTRAAVDLADGVFGTLTVASGVSSGTGLTVGGSSAANQTLLNFDVGGGISQPTDKLQVGATGQLRGFVANTGGAYIQLNSIGTLANGTYPLITFSGAAPTGITFPNGTNTINGFGPSGAGTVTLSTSTGVVQITVTNVPATPATAYWTGGTNWTDLSGANTNFTSDAGGTTNTQSFPGGNTDVFFTANTASTTSSALGANFVIKSLTITGTGTSATAPVSITDSNFQLGIDTGGITLNAGSGTTTIGTKALLLAGNQTWANNSSNSLVINSPITGNAGVTITGAGLVQFSNANSSYAGGTTIGTGGTAGKLQIIGTGTLGALSGPLTVTNGSLDLNGTNQIVGLLSGGASGRIRNNASGPSLLTIGNVTNASGTFAGIIEDNNNAGTGTVALTKLGGGTVTLSGANTYSGNTTISGGVVLMANQLALQNSTVVNNVANGLQFDSSVATHIFQVDTLATTNNSGLSLQDNGANAIKLTIAGTHADVTYGGVISGLGGLVKNGPKNLTLSAANSFTGDITVNGGILSTTSANNALNVTVSGFGNPQVAHTVTANGAGTIISSDSAGGNAFGNGPTIPLLAFVMNDGTVLRITSGNDSMGPITLDGATMHTNSFVSAQFQGWELGSTLTVHTTSTHPSLIDSNAANRGLNLTINQPAGAQTPIIVDAFAVPQPGVPELTISAPLYNSAQTQTATGFVKSGLGTVMLSGANQYTGTTTINQGTVLMGANGIVLGSLAPTSSLALGGGTFAFTNDGFTQQLNTLQLTANSTIDLAPTGAVTLQFANSSAQSWTGGAALRISNWVSGTDHVLMTGDGVTLNGLSAGQLAAVHFTGLVTGARLVQAANMADSEILPSLSSTILYRGDVSQDLHVNAADVSALEVALTDIPSYKSGSLLFPGTSTHVRSNFSTTFYDPDVVDVADMTGDNLVNNLDLQGLVVYLANNPTGLPAPPGGGSLTAVPEPATLALFGLGGLILAAAGLRSRQQTGRFALQRNRDSGNP